MKSVRELEGYLMLDHRHGAPVPDEVVVHAGLPVGAGRGLFESATYTCKHCQRVIVLGMNREKPATFCRGCQHMICDPCAAEKHRTGVCRTFDQVIEEALAATISPKEF